MAPSLLSFPSSHVPFAVLNEAARSNACFVVCSAGGRAKTLAGALHAATKGGGLVLSSAVVARAVKRSGEVDDGQGDDRTGKVTGGFLFGAGEDTVENDDADLFVLGAGEDRIGEEKYENGDTKLHVFGSGEITMEELVRMFQNETATLLKEVKQFPMDDDDTVLSSLIASCDAIGGQLGKVRILDNPEGQRLVNSLVALHLRIVSCVGRVELLNPGSYLPDMWAGNRHRLPRKGKLAGTMMEVLLYSRMRAGTALGPYLRAQEWDFTSVEGAGPQDEETD